MPPLETERVTATGQEIVDTLAQMGELRRARSTRPSAAAWDDVRLRIKASARDPKGQVKPHDYYFANAMESFISDGITVLTWASPWSRLRFLASGEDEDVRTPSGIFEATVRDTMRFQPCGIFDLHDLRGEIEGSPFHIPGALKKALASGDAVRGVASTSAQPVARAAPGQQALRALVFDTDRAQDDGVRFQPSGLLIVEGPPGTGKTTIAVQRAAYLLSEDARDLHRLGSAFSVSTTTIFVMTNSLIASIERELHELRIGIRPTEYAPWRNDLLRQHRILGPQSEIRRRRADLEGSTEAFLKSSRELVDAFEASARAFWPRFWRQQRADFVARAGVLSDALQREAIERFETLNPRASARGKEDLEKRRASRRRLIADDAALIGEMVGDIGRLFARAVEVADGNLGSGIGEIADGLRRYYSRKAKQLTDRLDQAALDAFIELLSGLGGTQGLNIESINPQGERRDRARGLLESLDIRPLPNPFAIALAEFAHAPACEQAFSQAAKRFQLDKDEARRALSAWRQALGATSSPLLLSEVDCGLVMLFLQSALSRETIERPAPWVEPLPQFCQVVVDEAQDFPLADLRFLARCSAAPHNSVTLSGDLRQAVRIGGGLQDWSDLGRAPHRYPPLAVTYRCSPEIGTFIQGYYEANFTSPAPFSLPSGLEESGRIELTVVDTGDPTDHLREALVCHRDSFPDESVAVFSFGGRSPQELAHDLDSLLADHGITVRASEAANLLDARVVHCASADGAKGLEFDTVVVVIENAAALDSEHPIERRLLANRVYVALTRARRGLTVLSSKRWPWVLQHLTQ